MVLQSRALHAFLVVAEELHFGNAARRLNVSQPPLSQMVRRLEAELGVTLFLRSTRMVQLTPAGQLLQQWATRHAADGAALVRQLRRISAGEAGTVGLGFSSSVTFRLLPRLLGSVHATWPELTVDLHEGHSSKLIKLVLDARLDIALVRKPAAASIDGLLFKLVEREPFYVAMPASHPLAAQAAFSVRQLHEQPFIGYQADTATYFRERTHSLFAGYQVHPAIVTESALPTVLALVLAGVGLALVPASAEVLYRDEIVYKPLVEDGPLCAVELFSVRKAGDPGPTVRALEESLRQFAVDG